MPILKYIQNIILRWVILMRKVELDMDENNEYEVIKKLVETNGNVNTARVRLGCSKKTIDRMIKGYKTEGKAYFIHGNKGHQPAHTIPDDRRRLIIDLYQNKYYGANFLHFNELLSENEEISVSYTAVRNILMKENILSPKATRETRKRIKKALIEQQENPELSEPEKINIAQNIVDIEDAHPRRPRCAYFGEMIQMDASVHLWYEGSKLQLHTAIDDSTGTIVGGYFDQEETLNGYYNVLNQILTEYGIPYMFFTDRRTVFEYQKKGSTSIEEDTFTQFSYACKQMGIEIKTSSVPQAKGRVERLFQTLQSRLPIEMRLAGVTNIKQANEFLNSYLKKFNAKFALPIDHSKSVFEKQPSDSQINLTLAVISDRKIDSGHCIRYEKKYYKTMDKDNNPVYYRKGTEALVIKAFNGDLYANVNDTIYALEEVALRETSSENFDSLPIEPKPKVKYIPPMSHPWKRTSFMNYQKKQQHLQSKEKPA
jgi:transposase